jgi:TolB-like protein/Tfp pilus assembly protein PilF
MTVTPPIASVSHYRLLERIGRGAMGEVWLAEDTQLPRRVAVKLLPRELALDAQAVERLLREAQAAASVDHPNVVVVHEAGMVDGHAYLVMQRVEGETLEQRLRRGPLPIDEAVRLATAIADALAEVHALGIVHRDLKPSNVMLTARGPKVLDFGIAAVRGAERMTEAGSLVGTPLFMSPEQVRGLPADNRSDLWALGVILYESLTGKRPFGGDSLAAMAHSVLTDEPGPPSRLNASVPPALDAVIEKLLRKDAARRYARAEDVLADLAGLGGPAPVADTLMATVATARAENPAPRLAVLEFEVLSPDPDDAFLAAGLTEDLSIDLARVEGLRVAARGEVQALRGRELPPRTIARELGVDYVVQGSVRRAGQRARISAQLVRASDGHASWAERFDRTIEDLFDVQAEVSRRIVDALQVTLRPAEREMLDRAPTKNRAAYELYLRARVLLDQNRRDANVRAGEVLERAVELDPDFALAHAALAECYGNAGSAWWAGKEILERARPHALRAIELDPNLREAHMAMGFVHRLEGDAEGVVREFRLSAPPDTTDPLLLRQAGWALLTQGRPEEAVGVLERAHQLHPRNYRIASALADCYVTLGRHDDELRMLATLRETLVETVGREPDNTDARIFLAIVLAQSGDGPAGIAQAERVLAQDPGDGRIRYNAACTFTLAGEPDRAMEQLRAMIAMIPSYLNDWVRRDPDLKALRERPDFIELFGKA